MSVIRRVISRMKPGEDIGLDHAGRSGRQRSINTDGSFNMERKTGRLLGNFFLYHWLIITSWKNYMIAVVGFYLFDNVVFGSIYFLLGPESLNGIIGSAPLDRFMSCFFFSCQTFTTVGYGGLHPASNVASAFAAIEAFLGLMAFALVTGTLYGRFSRPVSKIKFSRHILIAPFKGGTAMQLMVANQMSSTLMDVEARVNISWNDMDENGNAIRRFQQVKLEVDKITMFPTSWKLNHPIDEESILYGKHADDILRDEMEVFVLLKAFDDVFSQTIYSRQSYVTSQFVYGARFITPFYYNSTGKVVLDLTRVGAYETAEVPTLG